jgi:hypothetical protein
MSGTNGSRRWGLREESAWIRLRLGDNDVGPEYRHMLLKQLGRIEEQLKASEQKKRQGTIGDGRCVGVYFGGYLGVTDLCYSIGRVENGPGQMDVKYRVGNTRWGWRMDRGW